MKYPFSTALALVTLASTPLLAADTTWISPAGSAWANGANWSSGSSPSPTVGGIFTNGAVSHSIDASINSVTTVGIQFLLGSGGSSFDLIQSGGGGMMNLRSGGTANGIINNDSSTALIDIAIAMFSQNGFTGIGAGQTWNAANAGIVLSGNYGNSGVSTVNNNGGTLTVTGGFNTTIGTSGRGDIVGGGGLIKNGTGTLTLGGTVANSYTSNTVVNAGILAAGKTGAIGGGLILNGGAFNGAGFNENVGVMGLGSSSTIDFTGAGLGHFVGPAGSNTLAFANSSGAAWTGTLTILDWNPNEKIKFGSNNTGLTATQLGQILFADLPNTPSGQILADGTVIPVPEPSTAALAVLGGSALALSFVARRRKA